MDNNRFIGFTLIMLLILTYYTFFPPGQIQEYENVPQTNDKEELVNNLESEIKEIEEILNQEFSSNEKEQIISIENNILFGDNRSSDKKIIPELLLSLIHI